MEIIEKHDPTTLILSFCYTDINELNTILRSQGLYADLIISKDYSNIAGCSKGKLIQFDPVQKKILDEYLWNDPYAIMLIGHYGSGKTLLLVEMMGIKSETSHLQSNSLCDCC